MDLPTLDETEEAQASILTESRAAIGRAASNITSATLNHHLDVLEKLAILSKRVSLFRCEVATAAAWREIQAFTRLLPLEVRQALHSSLTRQEDVDEGNGLTIQMVVLAPSRQAACRVLGRALDRSPEEIEQKIFYSVAACLDAREGVWLQKP